MAITSSYRAPRLAFLTPSGALRIMLIACALAGLCSCGTARKPALVQDYTAEEFILLELESLMALEEGSCERALLDEAYSWQGTPYVWGGHSKKGTDCSGFVMEVYMSAFGIKLPRNSAKQAEACRRIGRGDLQTGDLVFFNTTKQRGITHVGIYIGNGRIIHASSSKGVVVSNLDAPYYSKAYVQAGRIPAFESLARRSRK